MHKDTDELNQLLDSVFSDETELFRTPAEPQEGDSVKIRFRMKKGSGKKPVVISETGEVLLPMKHLRTDAFFDWFEAELRCGTETIRYCFYVPLDDTNLYYTRKGHWVSDQLPDQLPELCFSIIPGFHVPEWAKGALQYQIFPDRFCSSDPKNDVTDGEYFYAGGFVSHAKDWEELPKSGDYRHFYGGDLGGILEKLDYLVSLGVEAVYLNPIFVSPSSHGYDIQDYDHVDPHLTVISKDRKQPKQKSKDNRRALRYIQRTVDEENLNASNAFFAHFCQELHKRGIRIILDGVFNHCGSFHKWLDHEGIYDKAGIPGGAFRDPKSRYRHYFYFNEKNEYEAWYGLETLPKLNYEDSHDVIEEICRIGEKWASEPYCIDGWRLDVGADLAHSLEVNHQIWKEFRSRVRKVNPDVLIIAEHYGDPSAWLQGDEWDSVMNYDAFMEPLTFFLTGMEKHSEQFRPDVYQNGIAFFHMMQDSMVHLPSASVLCAMNQLSNHDHSRFLTRTNCTPGRLESMGSEAAGEGVSKAVFREAVVVQMTWPGAPTIYYGDEAGLVGWTDPDNRRTYPWGREDQELIRLHQALAAFRKRWPLLRKGSLKSLCSDQGMIAYARFDADQHLIVVCNNNDHSMTAVLPLAGLGLCDGTLIRQVFSTGPEGFSDKEQESGAIKNGCFECNIDQHSARILTEVRK